MTCVWDSRSTERCKICMASGFEMFTFSPLYIVHSIDIEAQQATQLPIAASFFDYSGYSLTSLVYQRGRLLPTLG